MGIEGTHATINRNALGDYEIIKEIGLGPLGAVYLVEHKFIKKTFIAKVLPASLQEDAPFCERFIKQIQDISSLSHPHIVKVQNVSSFGDRYFIITDAVVQHEQSMHLGQYVKIHAKMTEQETFSLLEKIACALDYAHERGVVHGMLKPSNILVKETLSGLDVFVSDFGLAPILGEGYLLTQIYRHVANSLSIHFDEVHVKEEFLPILHQSFTTSYFFLSPEQKMGQIPTLYSDVYAFGILAYFLLTKEYPEGLFDMPSSRGRFSFNWDHLIRSTLRKESHQRVKKLSLLMQEVSQQKHLEVKKEEKKDEPTLVTKPEDYIRQISIEDLSKLNITKTKMAGESAPYTVPVEAQPAPPTYADSLSDKLQPKPLPVHAIRSTVSPMKMNVEKPLRPIIEPQKIQKPVYEPDPSSLFTNESTVAPYRPQEKEDKVIEPLLTEMIILKEGEFVRGSNEGARDERRSHKIFLNSFAIDIHPVTNEQFVRFLEMLGGEKDHNNNDIIKLRDSRIHRNGGKYVIESGYAKHPVVGITWYGAISYAKWVGKRLPTEAEWEVSARSCQPNILYPTGYEINKEQANYFSSDTTPVCTYPSNLVGLYDIAGNVYEWCEDWYDYNYYEISQLEPSNPKGPHQGVYRVLRGGCWKSLKDDLRCSHRHRNNPGATNNMYGFRCASDVS